MNPETLKYPVGPFSPPTEINEELISEWKSNIAAFPSRIHDLVDSLNDEQLSWIYRPDGWSIRQVVHHCADSHMNAFIRFKLTLTEENPTIKPYRQGNWSTHPDYQLPVQVSMKILEGVHTRWMHLMDSMTKNEYRRTYFHPEMNIDFRLDVALALYSWHSRHHSAHIEQAINHRGQF